MLFLGLVQSFYTTSIRYSGWQPRKTVVGLTDVQDMPPAEVNKCITRFFDFYENHSL
jgi:hypothetical protein